MKLHCSWRVQRNKNSNCIIIIIVIWHIDFIWNELYEIYIYIYHIINEWLNDLQSLKAPLMDNFCWSPVCWIPLLRFLSTTTRRNWNLPPLCLWRLHSDPWRCTAGIRPAPVCLCGFPPQIIRHSLVAHGIVTQQRIWPGTTALHSPAPGSEWYAFSFFFVLWHVVCLAWFSVQIQEM